MPKPHASSYKEYVRKRTTQLIHEGYQADQAYAIANSEARKRFREVAEEVQESPTISPWSVAVRTTEPEKVERLAGIKGHRTARGIYFTFYDDERAASLARTLTRHGYLVTWGPEASVAAEDPAAQDCPVGVPTKPCAGEASGKYIVAYLGTGARRMYLGSQFHSIELAARQVRYLKRRGFTAWVETTEGQFVPVRGATKQPKYMESQAMEAPFASVERDPKLVDEGKKFGTATGARAVYDMVQEQLNKESQEVFLVIPVDLHGDPLCPPVEIARGQRDRVSVDTSDILRPVVSHNASGFIVIHNHPSGFSKPSEADRDLTKRIQKATKTFEPVCFIDHVIVGRHEYYSIVEDKRFKVK